MKWFEKSLADEIFRLQIKNVGGPIEALVRKSGVSRSTIDRIREGDDRERDNDTIRRLCAALGLEWNPFDELVGVPDQNRILDRIPTTPPSLAPESKKKHVLKLATRCAKT